jgi:hypothetical protein
MKNPTVRYLVCFLGAWIASEGMVLSLPALAAPRPPASAMIETYYGMDLAVDTPASIGLGNVDRELLLGEQDSLGTDVSALPGLEPSQTLAAVDSPTHQRVAVTVQACPLYSTMFVEPRFLRYCRILN